MTTTEPRTDHCVTDAHSSCVGAAQTPEPAILDATSKAIPSARVQSSPEDASTGPILADPLLAMAADVLDDLERVRIANENRLRQLTRTEADKDSTEDDIRTRGFGLPLDHPDVARLAALVDALILAEEDATANLEYRMKIHPLGPWVKRMRGVGEKQAARLLASVGDPYWNDLHDRPRLVSELRSYAGYGDPVAQVRRKGVKSNWSDAAKMRAHMVAKSTMKQLVKPCHVIQDTSGSVAKYMHAVHVDGCACSPYRVVYDNTRAKYADAVHDRPCVRCGPKGKPAQPGSPISAKHNEARALREVCKVLLLDLWREAKRLHESPGDHSDFDAHRRRVAGDPYRPTKKRAKQVAAPTDEPERPVCLVCGDDRGTRKDGTVRAHPYAGYSDGRKCPGSLLQPKWVT